MTEPMSPVACHLHVHSDFSLLDAASSPEELVEQAAAWGYEALALTDHDSLAGAVRFWKAAERAGVHPIFGAEVTLEDNHHLTLLAEDATGYANLCRLITASRPLPAPDEPWPGKTPPHLAWNTLERYTKGLLCLSGCRRGPVTAPLLHRDEVAAQEASGRLVDIFGRDRLWIELQHHDLPEDDRLVRDLLKVAQRVDVPTVATHNVHYATPDRACLRDALIAIRHNETLDEARRNGHLPLNSSYSLQSHQAMARRFHEHPDALQASAEIAQRCHVSLDFGDRRLPHFPTPQGQSEFTYLYELCHNNLPRRYPDLRPAVLKQLAHELDVIERAGLAGYFLIVWDMVRFAREQGIRCQGRGSAANSIVAYLLGITSVDPLAHDLLFERFLSADQHTMPDIDLDFAADRREEVIQYVYRRYGADHTAMVCNVVTYRARSALRDLAKALDFPPEAVDRLAKGLDTHSCIEAAHQLRALPGEEAPDLPGHATHPLHLLADLMEQMEGRPRHLSIHVGGMLITGPPLTEVVPLEPATMPGRVICQWEKDSVEDAGLIKIDLLGLRTLGVISETIQWIGHQGLSPPDLDALPLDDPEIYRMLQRADTIGCFQVESRAQQQMLPRLRPERFEDIVVEVAIVRPGPIQGGAVHPYMRRRAGLSSLSSRGAVKTEPIRYTHPALEPVLKETLGVLLFQEQAIRVAVAVAGFTPSQADLLRRAMSRSRSTQAMAEMKALFLEKAAQQGVDPETAEAVFAQLEGFAGFGFCKSHAASFALIAYQTLHLKRYHPVAFACALLNHQPMGFYPPEVIVEDAKRHGVRFLPPDVNHSRWTYTLERGDDGHWAIRIGLRTVSGLGEAGCERLVQARSQGAFRDLADFCRRTRLHRSAVEDLIRAGALDSFGSRRELLWGLEEAAGPYDGLRLEAEAETVHLPALLPWETTAWEYELLGYSPAGQVMAQHREALRRAGIWSVWQVKQARPGRRVQVAGMAVVRQRPRTAKGITFLSLEDESGLLDVVIKPAVYARCREILRRESLLLVEGIVQRQGQAASLLAGRVLGLSSGAFQPK